MSFKWLLILSVMIICHSSAGSEISVENGANSDLKPTLDVNPQSSVSKNTPDSSSQESVAREEIPQSLKDAQHFEELYSGAVKSYNNRLWYSCASKFERALSGYKLHTRIVSDCRLECKKDPSQSKLSNLSSTVDNFDIFGTFLKSSDCLRRCADESLGSTYVPISRWAMNVFKERRAYDYLQFCYHKLDQPKKAASAAYTYFLAHSEDETSKKNVVYFRDGARVAEADFLDLEMLPYKEHYIRATIAYSEENWEDVVNHMEQCLEEFYLEHQRCELDCETKFFSSDHEFSTGVADWMLRIMTCKSECEKELSKVFIDPTEGFVRDMYSYLQYAYASLEKFDMAVQAAANFLVFDPTHDGMLENKNILTTTEGYTEKDFVPQQEVVDYVQKKSALVELIASIVKNYRPKANMQKHKEMLEDEEEEEYVEQDKDLYYEIEKSYEEMDDTDNWMERYEQLGMNVIARSVDLNRAERYVTDSLLKAEQCDELFKLTEDLQTEPQGSQIFTLKKAQQMLEADPSEDTEASLRLLSRSAEVVRHYTQRYLNPDMDYYLKKITFVCWPPSEEVERKCYPQEDGSCIKFEDMSDELYTDLYTTVTFLHTADDDSDFLFLNEEKGIDGTFGLRCGRTIGFNTGDRHTLNIPKSGSKRCAMVLKYTLDRKEDDKDYRNLLAMLHRVNELRMATVEQKPEVVLKKFADAGVKVTKEGKQLKAKERVVADGIASETQCNTLRNMVMSEALVGDGYEHLILKPSEISPHTHHELFRGMTIYRASKLAYDERISLGALRDFLELSESSRLFAEKYFNLTKPLYFDFTHLVCRTAVDGSNSAREDLSHPVHADNCNLMPDGSCLKEYPSFFNRDYSAILYLNDDFEGGEFFFAHANKSEQVSVRPKCGRLVAFNAGHFHGVKAVKKGQRCALALWFTHQAMFKELAHIQARKSLQTKEEEMKTRGRKLREDL